MERVVRLPANERAALFAGEGTQTTVPLTWLLTSLLTWPLTLNPLMSASSSRSGEDADMGSPFLVPFLARQKRNPPAGAGPGRPRSPRK